jgi:spermidine/putrescine transport system substrate-binding protein
VKKIVLLVTLSIALVALASCEAKESLKLFMPNEYISEDVLVAFEETYNVNVDLITFDSNEVAIPQVEVNRYDVVIPSDYAIEELVSKDLLDPIDWDLVDTISKTDLDPALVTLVNSIAAETNGFDLLEYSVPYFWGNVGILYDTTKITLAELEVLGWDALNDYEEEVMFYDSSRDMIMVALKALYEGSVDINQPTDAQLSAAEAWLLDASRVSTVNYASDEILDDMLISGETAYAMAVSYSGDAVYLMSENEDLGYYVPASGTNVWIDGMVVPKNAPNKTLAYQFISFVSDFDYMFDNSDYIGYTAPRLDVAEAIILEGYYPEESYRMTVGSNDSVFRYSEAIKEAVANVWARVRAS